MYPDLAGPWHQLLAPGEEDTQPGAGVLLVVVVVAAAVLGVEADGPTGLLAGEGVGGDIYDVVPVCQALVGQAADTVLGGLCEAVLAGASAGAGG